MVQPGENTPDGGTALTRQADTTAIVSPDALVGAMITGIQEGVAVEADKDVPDANDLIVHLRQDDRFEEFLSNIETDPEIQTAFTRLVDSLRSSIMVAAGLEDDASKEVVLAGAKESIAVFVRQHAVSIFERVSANQQLIGTIKHLTGDPEGMAASIPLSAADELVRGLDRGGSEFVKALFARIKAEAQKRVNELAEEWKDAAVAQIGVQGTQSCFLEPKLTNDLLVIGLHHDGGRLLDGARGRSLEALMRELVNNLNDELKARRLSVSLKTNDAHEIKRRLRDGGETKVSCELVVSLSPYMLQGKNIV